MAENSTSVNEQLQGHMDDEVLDDADLAGAVTEWSQAKVRYAQLEAFAAQTEVRLAREKVIELLPAVDGRAHNYRIGAHVINVTPPGEDKTIVRRSHARYQLKEAPDDSGD